MAVSHEDPVVGRGPFPQDFRAGIHNSLGTSQRIRTGATSVRLTLRPFVSHNGATFLKVCIGLRHRQSRRKIIRTVEVETLPIKH